MTKKTAKPDPLDSALGAAIRERRLEISMSQAALGHGGGVSFQQIQKYERAADRVSFSMLVKLARAMRCEVYDLLAKVKGVPPGPVVRDEPIILPDAIRVLEALAEIPCPVRRNGVLGLARALADATDQQAE